jgi:hypothetical protein
VVHLIETFHGVEAEFGNEVLRVQHLTHLTALFEMQERLQPHMGIDQCEDALARGAVGPMFWRHFNPC